jgi:hypothetical protein
MQSHLQESNFQLDFVLQNPHFTKGQQFAGCAKPGDKNKLIILAPNG